MSIIKPATESAFAETIWRPTPEGLFRFTIGTALIVPPHSYGTVEYGYQVKFPLTLTESEKARVAEEAGQLSEGEQQSWRTSYSCGLSFGYFKQGAFNTTKLVDFLCFALGTQSAKALRKFFEEGGVPPRPADKDDADEEMKLFAEWLAWWENLEIYGTIRHDADKKDPQKMWARFSGPLPVGSLPGQKDDEYQAHGRGKLKAIIADAQQERTAVTAVRRAVEVIEGKPAVQFTQDGNAVTGDGSPELPF